MIGSFFPHTVGSGLFYDTMLKLSGLLMVQKWWTSLWLRINLPSFRARSIKASRMLDVPLWMGNLWGTPQLTLNREKFSLHLLSQLIVWLCLVMLRCNHSGELCTLAVAPCHWEGEKWREVSMFHFSHSLVINFYPRKSALQLVWVHGTSEMVWNCNGRSGSLQRLRTNQ